MIPRIAFFAFLTVSAIGTVQRYVVHAPQHTVRAAS